MLCLWRGVIGWVSGNHEVHKSEREAFGFMFMYRKNKDSEKTGARARKTPFPMRYAPSMKSLSRNLSASRAAMQPLPAEVIA
uniref:Uncharacterized protein n=1 Tax=Candidatus Kentrum sp. SD TaxID=2126332 RepID=A0A451BN50_9GAMM|nr:MAG: hypothetical protein BECKSD772D_GA0070982_10626 [Candidatus Kentron sp. SD]